MYLAEGVEVTQEEADWVLQHQDLPCVKTFMPLYQMQMRHTDPGGNALMVCAWRDCMEARSKQDSEERETDG